MASFALSLLLAFVHQEQAMLFPRVVVYWGRPESLVFPDTRIFRSCADVNETRKPAVLIQLIVVPPCRLNDANDTRPIEIDRSIVRVSFLSSILEQWKRFAREIFYNEITGATFGFDKVRLRSILINVKD